MFLKMYNYILIIYQNINKKTIKTEDKLSTFLIVKMVNVSHQFYVYISNKFHDQYIIKINTPYKVSQITRENKNNKR